MIKKIIDTTELNDMRYNDTASYEKLAKDAKKAQIEAATVVVDETKKAAQFETMPVNISYEGMTAPATGPSQGFRKSPDKKELGLEVDTGTAIMSRLPQPLGTGLVN